ncbi:hypothetical protein W97_01561 [Coniosporium apollinis CBS 100218]|uniref:Uncharacterized protein n=1 Tax=Coniosporium apollinis (strain CBS 100218) TaxID=1168221 RepID=R7YKB0_CONA1|nr:uncharacterized protein W97_01561 [Coniosporium apollinis CBS 100218]EON62340.1 hypothetical protein W97_01561 [Coniosporium apollinis CBS 100218]
MAALLLGCFGLGYSKASDYRAKRASRQKTGSREYDENFADMQAANARRVSQQKSSRNNSIRHMEDPAFTGGGPPSYDAAVRERGGGGGGGGGGRTAGLAVGSGRQTGTVPLTPQLSPGKRVAENDFA